ncbi:MAG: aldehyde dehydrogenase family protein, partial [Burkholderiaceae bacterium]|nr:aldehyde dehydrogenase family protein [Burkholderiaceae bacterium]
MNAPQAFEIKEDIAHYIGGQIVLPQSSRFADVYNPAKGSISRRVALASKADVNQAVATAHAAFPAWANTSPLRRARILFKYLELLNRHRDELAADGTNEWTKAFKAYVFSERSARREIIEGRCEHPAKQEGELCRRCAVFGENGEPIAETGRYRREARTYLYPMRAAISRLRRSTVPDGMPPLSSV